LLYLYIIIRNFGYFVNRKYPKIWIFLIFFSNLLPFCIVKYPHLWILNKYATIADMKVMTGETLDEIAESLGISMDAVEKRLQTANIKPITRKALYPVGTIDMLRNVPGRGRPKKAGKTR
jgi:hypothetical protein